MKSALRIQGRSRLSSSQVKYVIGMATAAMASYVLLHALHLLGSYWSVFSAVIVFRLDFRNVLTASSDHLFRTVVGASAAKSQ